MSDDIRRLPSSDPDRPWRTEIEVRCCGSWLSVSGRFTTTCDSCGSDFNGFGQRLAPRAQWGEETGEHPEDCY